MAGLQKKNDHRGFCQQLDEDGFQVGNVTVRMWDLHAAAFVVSATVLAIWGWKQYATSSGYFVGEALVIFPVHMRLLYALGFTNFLQGFLITTFGDILGSDQSKTDLQIYLVANTMSYFFQVCFQSSLFVTSTVH